jgi:sugar phosphate isomerase/epimerase
MRKGLPLPRVKFGRGGLDAAFRLLARRPGAGWRHPALARMSLNQLTTVRWRLDEAVHHYRRAGLRGIGVSWQRLSAFGVREGIDVVRRSGLAVSSLGWIGGFTGAHGCSCDDALAEARPAVEAAARLGAQALIAVSGPQHGHIRSHARRLLVDALRVVADDAARHNVRLGLQPMHPIFGGEWSFVTSLDDALEVLARVDHPHVGLAFGSYHLWQEPGLLHRIAEIAPRVAVVQLSDWRDPPRCDNDRSLPGEGSLPLVEIVRSFESAGYRGLYEIEVWSRDLWKQGHATLMARSIARFVELYTGVGTAVPV